MAKRQGGSGFIYASIPLDMTQTFHELEDEKPGTICALILEYMDYAQAHAKDTTAPSTVPNAPAGFSLSARQTWRRMIETYNGKLESYISQVEGGKKAAPGPGRPKGSKNKPKQSAEAPEPDAEGEPEPDDIRKNGLGPWRPTETELTNILYAKAVSEYGGTVKRSMIKEIASVIWARLQLCKGFLAPHGCGGVSEDELKDLDIMGALISDPDNIHERADLLWKMLDEWADLPSCRLSADEVIRDFEHTYKTAHGVFFEDQKYSSYRELMQQINEEAAQAQAAAAAYFTSRNNP